MSVAFGLCSILTWMLLYVAAHGHCYMYNIAAEPYYRIMSVKPTFLPFASVYELAEAVCDSLQMSGHVTSAAEDVSENFFCLPVLRKSSMESCRLEI